MVKNFDQQRRNRINEQIRLSPVRVVQEGKQLGVMPTFEALRMARDNGLDLVEIAPNVRPPVCSIMDYGKFKYEQAVKEKERRQHTKANEAKELRLSPLIADHDIEVKAHAAIRFLEQKKTVVLNLKFANRRELAHKDEGFRVIAKFVEHVKEFGNLQDKPKFQGKSITCRIEPTK